MATSGPGMRGGCHRPFFFFYVCFFSFFRRFFEGAFDLLRRPPSLPLSESESLLLALDESRWRLFGVLFEPARASRPGDSSPRSIAARPLAGAGSAPWGSAGIKPPPNAARAAASLLRFSRSWIATAFRIRSAPARPSASFPPDIIAVAS